MFVINTLNDERITLDLTKQQLVHLNDALREAGELYKGEIGHTPYFRTLICSLIGNDVPAHLLAASLLVDELALQNIIQVLSGNLLMPYPSTGWKSRKGNGFEGFVTVHRSSRLLADTLYDVGQQLARYVKANSSELMRNIISSTDSDDGLSFLLEKVTVLKSRGINDIERLLTSKSFLRTYVNDVARLMYVNLSQFSGDVSELSDKDHLLTPGNAIVQLILDVLSYKSEIEPFKGRADNLCAMIKSQYKSIYDSTMSERVILQKFDQDISQYQAALSLPDIYNTDKLYTIDEINSKGLIKARKEQTKNGVDYYSTYSEIGMLLVYNLVNFRMQTGMKVQYDLVQLSAFQSYRIQNNMAQFINELGETQNFLNYIYEKVVDVNLSDVILSYVDPIILSRLVDPKFEFKKFLGNTPAFPYPLVGLFNDIIAIQTNDKDSQRGPFPLVTGAITINGLANSGKTLLMAYLCHQLTDNCKIKRHLHDDQFSDLTDNDLALINVQERSEFIFDGLPGHYSDEIDITVKSCETSNISELVELIAGMDQKIIFVNSITKYISSSDSTAVSKGYKADGAADVISIINDIGQKLEKCIICFFRPAEKNQLAAIEEGITGTSWGNISIDQEGALLITSRYGSASNQAYKVPDFMRVILTDPDLHLGRFKLLPEEPDSLSFPVQSKVVKKDMNPYGVDEWCY